MPQQAYEQSTVVSIDDTRKFGLSNHARSSSRAISVALPRPPKHSVCTWAASCKPTVARESSHDMPILVGETLQQGGREGVALCIRTKEAMRCFWSSSRLRQYMTVDGRVHVLCCVVVRPQVDGQAARSCRPCACYTSDADRQSCSV